VLENEAGKFSEEELDISEYLKLLYKPKFEKNFKELEIELRKRRENYYNRTDLYKFEHFRIERMESNSLVKTGFSYFNGKKLKLRCCWIMAKKSPIRVLLMSLVFFAVIFTLVIKGKRFGKSCDKYKKWNFSNWNKGDWKDHHKDHKDLPKNHPNEQPKDHHNEHHHHHDKDHHHDHKSWFNWGGLFKRNHGHGHHHNHHHKHPHHHHRRRGFGWRFM